MHRQPRILRKNCEFKITGCWPYKIQILFEYVCRIEKGLKKETIIEFLENLAKLINPEYIDALFLKTYQILEGMGYTTDKLMFELMQPCINMIKDCSWLGKIVPCDSLFRVAKSSEGFCCSFNYQALKDNLEMCVRFPIIRKLESKHYYACT